LEFIKIRDKIVHEGYGGEAVGEKKHKLFNLLIRLILSILEYKGSYHEYRRIDLKIEVGLRRIGLAHRTFPFDDANNTIPNSSVAFSESAP
jgi:hypothetical protein